MSDRKYQWSFAELLDRITIVSQKIAYSDSEEMRLAFVQERDDIIHDLDLFLSEGVKVDGKTLSHLCYLQLVNATIWNNESAFREGGSGDNLPFTHGLNSNRAEIKKVISERVKGRVDHKLNYNKGIWDLRL